MKKILFILIVLTACVTNDKESSGTYSYIENSTPYQVKISFFKNNSIISYFTIDINSNSKHNVNYYQGRGKSVGYSYYQKIESDDSIVFQFNTDTFLTHYNKQIDTTNKSGYGITWPNNILNPSSFKLTKIKETKRSAEYEYVYEITNQDFLNARK